MNHLHRYKGFICSVVLGAVKTFPEFLGLVFAYPEPTVKASRKLNIT